LPVGRSARLGATLDFHDGLLTKLRLKPTSEKKGRWQRIFVYCVLSASLHELT